MSDTQSRSKGTPGARGLAAPLRVLRVDVDESLPDLEPSRVDAGTDVGAWVFVTRGPNPIGILEISFAGGGISSSELQTRIDAAFSRRILAPSRALHFPESELPAASVVVATNFARFEDLTRSISALGALAYPDFEIIVVDNRRSEAVDISQWNPLIDSGPVQVVHEPTPGISAARNRGVSMARGEIVAFTDDDAEVEVNWLRALAGRFVADPRADCVNGLTLPRELETDAQLWFERSGSGPDRVFEPLMFELEAGHQSLRSVLAGSAFRVVRYSTRGPAVRYSLYATGEYGSGVNMSFRTKALRSIGGFDEALGIGTPTLGGEDICSYIRVLSSGRRLVREPRALVWHTHRRTREDLQAQMYGYGVGLVALLEALAVHDSAHIFGIGITVPRAVRALFGSDAPKRRRRGPDYPRELSKAELVGMAAGFLAYPRSVRALRASKQGQT